MSPKTILQQKNGRTDYLLLNVGRAAEQPLKTNWDNVGNHSSKMIRKSIVDSRCRSSQNLRSKRRWVLLFEPHAAEVLSSAYVPSAMPTSSLPAQPVLFRIIYIRIGILDYCFSIWLLGTK